MGAIASGGVRVLNHDVVSWLRIPDHVIDEVAREEQAELERREREYRGDQPPVDLRHRVVILVDDGLATGSTMRAAVEAVRKYEPSRIVVAVPVAPPSTCTEFERIADEVVCAQTPEPFSAVGLWYRDFSQTTDEESGVIARTSRAASRSWWDGVRSSSHGPPKRRTLCSCTTDDCTLAMRRLSSSAVPHHHLLWPLTPHRGEPVLASTVSRVGARSGRGRHPSNSEERWRSAASKVQERPTKRSQTREALMLGTRRAAA